MSGISFWATSQLDAIDRLWCSYAGANTNAGNVSPGGTAPVNLDGSLQNNLNAF